jgi:hypothetical protein
VPFGNPAMFGGFGRDPLDVGNELHVALPGCRQWAPRPLDGMGRTALFQRRA